MVINHKCCARALIFNVHFLLYNVDVDVEGSQHFNGKMLERIKGGGMEFCIVKCLRQGMETFEQNLRLNDHPLGSLCGNSKRCYAETEGK